MQDRTIEQFDALQIETIIDKLVPLIAKEEDREFFRGVLTLVAENQSKAQFAAFVKKLLDR